MKQLHQLDFSHFAAAIIAGLLTLVSGAKPIWAENRNDAKHDQVTTEFGNHCCEFACCPDDYCRKPSPCAGLLNRWLPDCYRSKPCLVLPCPVKCCCPDDYQRKPCLTPCSQVTRPWYKCIADPSCHCLPEAGTAHGLR